MSKATHLHKFFRIVRVHVAALQYYGPLPVPTEVNGNVSMDCCDRRCSRHTRSTNSLVSLLESIGPNPLQLSAGCASRVQSFKVLDTGPDPTKRWLRFKQVNSLIELIGPAHLLNVKYSARSGQCVQHLEIKPHKSTKHMGQIHPCCHSISFSRVIPGMNLLHSLTNFLL